ncbi:MAG: hypothetical protein U9N11_03185 [Campylobacterota bacterium]|nr:hypothetical protein [Campylobacterota bacterium]
MIKSKQILIFSSLLLLSGCSSKKVPVHQGGHYHSGVYFGTHFTDHFKRGIKDGCATSKGKYTKSHWFFKRKKDYVDGWFLGRNRCKHLLVIEKD